MVRLGIGVMIAMTAIACTRVSFDNAVPAATVSAAGQTATEQIMDACQRAIADGGALKVQAPIHFEDAVDEFGMENTCRWGEDGNLPKMNGFMTARSEQTRSLPLPAGAVICDVALSFPRQKFQYDDNFFFTVNGAVVATNAGWSLAPLAAQRLADGTSYSAYDWTRLAGQEHPADLQSPGYNFCLGQSEGLSDCAWPLTQDMGEIKLSLDPRLSIGLGLLATDDRLTLGFVTTGDDNDGIDCRHAPVDLHAEITYIQK